MSVENPVAHMPEVYMPKLPCSERSTRGATATRPAIEVMLLAGARHMGVCEGVTLAVRVWDAVWLGEAVPVTVLDELPVVEDDGVPVWVLVPVELLEPVPVALDDAEPVGLLEPEPVELLDPDPVELGDAVLVWLWLPVPVELLEPVPVALLDPEPELVALSERVVLGDGVPAPVTVPVVVALREYSLDSSVASERTPAPRTSQLPPPPASPSRVRTPA
jgi:hypothetical protein